MLILDKDQKNAQTSHCTQSRNWNFYSYANLFASTTSFRRRRASDVRVRIRSILHGRLLSLLAHGGYGAGLHQYDTQLEDYSAAGIQKEIAALHEFEKKVEAIDPSALDASVAGDREILLNNIHSQLLTLEVIRPWEKNPDTYSSGVTNSIFVIMERPYAPADTRLHAVVEREKLIPQVLEEARKNLKNPPHIYTEIALEQIDGLISFFQNDVPSAFSSVTDPDTKADFAKSNAAVIEALKSYGAWMKTDLLPRSNGDFRLGADTFRKKLAYDVFV